MTSNSKGHSPGWAVQCSDSTNPAINSDLLYHTLCLETIVHPMIIHLHLFFAFCFSKDEEFGLPNVFIHSCTYPACLSLSRRDFSFGFSFAIPTCLSLFFSLCHTFPSRTEAWLFVSRSVCAVNDSSSFLYIQKYKIKKQSKFTIPASDTALKGSNCWTALCFTGQTLYLKL